MKVGDTVALHESQHDIHGGVRLTPDAQGVVYSEHTFHQGWFYVTFPGKAKNLLFDSDDLRVINVIDLLAELTK